MLDTTFFHNDGSASSTRKSTGVGSVTNYVDGEGGGSTFKVGNISSRMGNNGQFLGSSIKMGNSTTYFGSSGGIRHSTPSLSRSNSGKRK